ncbi:uncharacterized protein B0T15DRAFT_506461 [Chaetomium strumarium]|uniref:Uncharacterized protein n=1 Tax=Chaetomium strumarium TaxID=1170767 RepID=A0AAJ0H0W7_9PEZI|nr:hypothetical protein B0T15DRAFT_506461 [Chaetomium strumarium]
MAPDPMWSTSAVKRPALGYNPADISHAQRIHAMGFRVRLRTRKRVEKLVDSVENNVKVAAQESLHLVSDNPRRVDFVGSGVIPASELDVGLELTRKLPLLCTVSRDKARVAAFGLPAHPGQENEWMVGRTHFRHTYSTSRNHMSAAGISLLSLQNPHVLQNSQHSPSHSGAAIARASQRCPTPPSLAGTAILLTAFENPVRAAFGTTAEPTRLHRPDPDLVNRSLRLQNLSLSFKAN